MPVVILMIIAITTTITIRFPCTLVEPLDLESRSLQSRLLVPSKAPAKNPNIGALVSNTVFWGIVLIMTIV